MPYSRSIATVLMSTAAVIAIAPPGQAFRLYFGEDLNNSPTSPLSAVPNSAAAEVEFLSGLVGVDTATFNNLPVNTRGPLTLDFTGVGSATLLGDGIVRSVAPGTTNGFGRYAVAGSNFWEANAANDAFAIQFASPVAAFGFYGVDLGDFGGLLNLNLNLATGGTRTVSVPNTVGSNGSTDGSVLFFGLIAEDETELFQSISFNMSAPGVGVFADIFAFDKMTVGSLAQVVQPESPVEEPEPVESEPEPPVGVVPTPQAVPEPGLVTTLVLLGLGAMVSRQPWAIARSRQQ
ncbi:hypothetical protein [Leptolyngbya sp. PCC 6406]|uniref:hypothetical protein n=1 Tax=Leptolyngbya sp. PCC 6406 TaxID=1173264 RepID=UPI0002AC9257|nr:hypothetical protein [Leptolyngbya sp. PCC 6406]